MVHGSGSIRFNELACRLHAGLASGLAFCWFGQRRPTTSGRQWRGGGRDDIGNAPTETAARF